MNCPHMDQHQVPNSTATFNQHLWDKKLRNCLMIRGLRLMAATKMNQRKSRKPSNGTARFFR